MGAKRKGRSVRRNKQVKDEEARELVEAPHSFVIKRGLPGDHIGELTKDFRKIMEPYTAVALKERKKNTIKDFVSVSGLFHVTNLCIFSKTELGMYFKLAHLPRGPTLSFKVHSFSLARDVISSLKKQSVYDDAFKTPPLVVLNNFTGEMEMKLTAKMLQNMFPSINLTTVKLSTIRRCLLFNYNPQNKTIDMRHYVIKIKPTGVSKAVKKVIQGKVPNLSKFNDISEFVTKAGILSESEAEDDPSCHVTLPQNVSARGAHIDSLSAIRLSEIGPRLTLQLIKAEDGVCSGTVLFHELIHKTEEEIQATLQRRKVKEKLKQQRKKQQEENKRKKIAESSDAAPENVKDKFAKPAKKVVIKERDKEIRKATQDAFEVIRSTTVEDDDEEYYREEVGQDPDRDLFDKPPPRAARVPWPKRPRSDISKKINAPSSAGSQKKRKIDGRYGNRENGRDNNRFRTKNRGMKQSGGNDKNKRVKRSAPSDKSSTFKSKNKKFRR